MSNQNELNSLVSVHLGKAGDGSVVNPYVTPDDVDPSLLVGVPRSLNRTDYGIEEDELPFVGVDAWNAYEFSTLLKNGFPVSGWLKFRYDADSPNIVESKSVKLYLNSYNMARIMDSLDDLWLVEDKVASDIADVVGGDVGVSIYIGNCNTVRPITGDFVSLESYCDVEGMEFDQYTEDPNTLEVIGSDGKPHNWRSFSLRSNCRVTNQPDWGDVYVHIKGDLTVTPESLLKYIVSMRKENHFHEEVCECIYKRLDDLLVPEDLLVTCLYTRRGGIDINPVRASSYQVLSHYAYGIANEMPCEKTPRQ